MSKSIYDYIWNDRISQETTKYDLAPGRVPSMRTDAMIPRRVIRWCYRHLLVVVFAVVISKFLEVVLVQPSSLELVLVQPDQLVLHHIAVWPHLDTNLTCGLGSACEAAHGTDTRFVCSLPLFKCCHYMDIYTVTFLDGKKALSAVIDRVFKVCHSVFLYVHFYMYI